MEYVPIEEITPYEGNPRLNSEAVPMLAKSIDDFGFLVPIVVDKNGVIAAGHTRYLASLELGLTEVPVIRAEHLSDKQIKAFRLADNKVAELAGWDFGLLDLELSELEDDFNMEDYGFILDDFDEDDLGEDILEIRDPEPEEEREVRELKPELTVKKGDRIRMGRHTLLCGDPESSQDLDILLDGVVPHTAFSEPPTAYLDSLEVNRDLLLEKGVTDVAYVCRLDDAHKLSFVSLLSSGASSFKAMIYRTRPAELKSPGRLMPVTDPIPIFSSTNQTDVFDTDPGDWTGTVDCKDPYSPHLARTVLQHITDLDDAVLDCYGDTGNTLLACEDLGRSCYVIEQDPELCAMIVTMYVDRTGDREHVVLKRGRKEVKPFE